jgi:hypothetical protein
LTKISCILPPEAARRDEGKRSRPGHSCLLLGSADGGRAIHVVCAPKPDYLAIITAYIPHPDQWSADFKNRK